jgi:quinol monooxygenase YgiN
MPLVQVVIVLIVAPDKRKEIMQTFKAMLGPIRRLQGCLGCNCYVDIESENNILFIEEWRTREALDSHLQSNHFGVLVGAMKLLTQEPVIRFNTIESTAGASPGQEKLREALRVSQR